MAGCGSSHQPSRADVEHAVEQQARVNVGDSHGQKIAPVAKCVEDPSVARSYTCTVRVTIGSGQIVVTSPPQTAHAVVSKDGKRIVVDGV